jgi:hypothetical protein
MRGMYLLISISGNFYIWSPNVGKFNSRSKLILGLFNDILQPLRLCCVGLYHNLWTMNKNLYVRKRSWPICDTILLFVWEGGGGRNNDSHKNPRWGKPTSEWRLDKTPERRPRVIKRCRYKNQFQFDVMWKKNLLWSELTENRNRIMGWQGVIWWSEELLTDQGKFCTTLNTLNVTSDIFRLQTLFPSSKENFSCSEVTQTNLKFTFILNMSSQKR